MYVPPENSPPVRRIRRSEQAELAQLCRQDKRWEKYYRGHQVWLDKALKDVESKDRVVFGAFESYHEEGDVPTLRLIACIFIKLSPFDKSFELKNLILPSDQPNEKLSPSAVEAGRRLIEKAVRFCDLRNIPKIEIELPTQEHAIISIFLGLDFRIAAVRDRNDNGVRVNILERSIGDFYHGDPFYKVKFAQWLIRCYISCETSKPEEIQNLIRIPFESKPFTRAFSDDNQVGRDKRIHGSLWLVEDDELLESHIRVITSRPDYHNELSLLLADSISEELRQRLLTEKITSIDWAEAVEIAGGPMSSLKIPMGVDDIGGVITVLEQEQILSYAGKSSLTYYLLSGIHMGLNPDVSDEPLLLAVYCHNWDNLGAGIVGCWRIDSIERLQLRRLLKREFPKDSALTKEDLDFYATYSEDEWVAVLNLGEYMPLPQPLPIIRNGEWIKDEKIRKYLYRELIHNGNNSAYLDRDSAATLETEMQKPTDIRHLLKPEVAPATDVTDKRFKVGFSFSGKEKAIVEQIVALLSGYIPKASIFYYHDHLAHTSRPNYDLYLKSIYSELCDLVVPFFSLDYMTSPPCQMEWKVIREIGFSLKNPERLMYFTLDGSIPEGFSRLDGLIEASALAPGAIARLILQRLGFSESLPAY